MGNIQLFLQLMGLQAWCEVKVDHIEGLQCALLTCNSHIVFLLKKSFWKHFVFIQYTKYSNKLTK